MGVAIQETVAVCLCCWERDEWLYLPESAAGLLVDCECTNADGFTPRQYVKRRVFFCLEPNCDFEPIEGDGPAAFKERRRAKDHPAHGSAA